MSRASKIGRSRLSRSRLTEEMTPDEQEAHKLKKKEKILKRSIQKYAEENKQLFEESLNESGKNRASTILALHREMEQQDLVIEILRKLINDDKLLKSAIPSRMKGKIDKVTPKSREELRMEIRELDTKIEVLKGKYLRDFPQKQPDFYSDKQQQTEQIEIMDESFISNGLELSDVSVDPTLRDKEAEKKIEDLKFLLEQEKRKITNFEFLIQRKRGNMNKLVNMEGDLEIMRTNLEKEKSILDDLDEKNREVERKVQLYEQNSEKGIEEVLEQEKITKEKLEAIKIENSNFELKIKQIENKLKEMGNVSKRFEEKLKKIAEEKVRYENRVKSIKAVKEDLEMQRESLKATEDYQQKLKNQLEQIEARHQKQLNEVNIEKEDLELEAETAEAEINRLKVEIKESRRNEIKILDECDAIQKEYEMISDKCGAYYLMMRRKDPGLSEAHIELNREIGLKYDKKLSDTLKKNVLLKRRKQELQDYLTLLKQYQVRTPDMSQIKRMGIDSSFGASSVNSVSDSLANSVMLGSGGQDFDPEGIQFV